MAPKEKFKVHSLSKHIEETQKGLSADAQYNKRPGLKSAMAIKKEPGGIDKSIFGNDASDDGSSDESSSSGSSDEESSDFLRKLAPTSVKASNARSKGRSKDEEIADSDDERKAAANKTESGSETRPVKHEEASEDDASSESESEPQSAKTEEKGSAQSMANDDSSSSDRSSESDSDSDSDSGSEGDEDEKDSKPAAASQSAKQANGSAKTTSTSDTSSSEAESESEGQKANATPARLNKNGKPSSSSKSSDESSTETSDGGDAEESMHITDRKQDSRVALPDFIARDFVLRKSDDRANGQDVARVCSEANLQGKQVWYFTVPANVPISVVQNMEIPMNQPNRDDRVFSHDGEDYGISFDSMLPKSSIQILIPSADGVRYQAAPQQVNQVMHVKKVAQLGKGSLHALPGGPAPKEPVRAQPRGMKLRYQPFGVNSPMGQIGGDEEADVVGDVDMIDAPASATVVASSSAASKADKKEKKKRQKDGDTDTTRKGKRKQTSEDEAAAAAEQLMEETQSAKSKSKKQKTHRDMSPDLGSDEQSSPPPLPPPPPSSSSTTKKVTLVVPPKLPSSQPVASTPVPKSKKKSVRVETPVSVPRQSVVPIPVVPGSSQLSKVSPVPVPQPAKALSPVMSQEVNKVKDKKERKTKGTADSPKQSPPPSAQGSKRSTTKVTPVPAPNLMPHTG